MPRPPSSLHLRVEDFDVFADSASTGALRTGSAQARGRATRHLDLLPRMLRWARGIIRRFEEQGLETQAAALATAARTRKGGTPGLKVQIQEKGPHGADPSERAARWVLSIDAHGIDVSLEFPPVTPRTTAALRRALEEGDADDEGERDGQSLGAALEALPEQFSIGVSGERGTPAHEPVAFSTLLERSASTGRSIRVGWTVPRDVAVSHSDLLDEQLEDAMLLLLPIFRRVAHPDQSSESGTSTRGSASRAPSPGSPRGRPLLSRHRTGRTPANPSVKRGTKVRVLSGPFAGKVGVVKELDGKGLANVMLGLLSTRIDVKELSPHAGSGRPTLSSSHRRPMAAR